jgi:pyruvate kinase
MNSETGVIENIPASSDWDSAQAEQLIRELSVLLDGMLELEGSGAESLLRLNISHRNSAANLVHYMALRRNDIRRLQETLAALGLSSLGRAESHVKSNIETILSLLYRLTGQPEPSPGMGGAGIGMAESATLMEAHTEALLGPKPAHRNVRIMVTMPGEAALDYELVRDLLDRGMDCMRVNCAHDDAEAWSSMIANLRRAEEETGKHCRVLMDLAGPKLRTGPVEEGPRVIKWRPYRDRFGRVKSPARIRLYPIGSATPPPEDADACLPVPGEWLESLRRGDLIKFFDARGASRQMRVMGTSGAACRAESSQTAYVVPGTLLNAYHNGERGIEDATGSVGRVGEFRTGEQWIKLKKEDELILTRSLAPGKPARYDENGCLISPARIGVTLPDIFDDVRAGERVLLDDGKIGGLITSVSHDEMRVEITHARPRGEKLRADKGINLPDSDLRLPPLTDKDMEDLAFVAKHADMVGFSFVRGSSGIRALQARLEELGGGRLGIVLKIETEKAFEHLPNLILAAMHSPSAGVMIARGDLAVECGYERMAEVQEEILWICEAAHMPVIWATQVLESLAKDGIPSRAEITDAAMGERAECVMLNKGMYVVQALDALDDILRRMEGHQSKKRSMLRHLKLADQFNFGE